ncbi:ribosomal RNA small subunit methyltransferase B [mine drainage metagenome]|uniref:Ribosomal RNA small subunit methyltransferase B n=1 Tax=mine drainage metagenome TaxID=410659 RepID=A0A1J5SFX1_9ZZZZ
MVSRPPSAWTIAADRIRRWLEQQNRVDELMDRLPPGLAGAERARVQHLVYGVIRHHLRLERLLRRRVTKRPRDVVMAVLLVGGFELIEGQRDEADPVGVCARVVHHAVDQSKRLIAPSESGLVNAVLRRLSEDLAAEPVPALLAPSHRLAEYFSHPEWLVRRWQAGFGAAATRKLLEWNQMPGQVTVRWRPAGAEGLPDWLKATPWEGFYVPESGHWAEIETLIGEGRLYVQDPSTRLPVGLLDPKPGEVVLDLCAAPGGKSVMIADRMGSGRIVAVDLPGERQERLVENLGRVRGVECTVLSADLGEGLSALLSDRGLPQLYAAVLIDVPCSNTGVMRHRVDVKERLEESDLAKHARNQLRLLEAAAARVEIGGRLVYSTCSIDRDENEGVIEQFLKKRGTEFVREDSAVSLPWETGHDGAAAFRLRRVRAA